MTPFDLEEFFKNHPSPTRENHSGSDLGHIPLTSILGKWLIEKGEELEFRVRHYGVADNNNKTWASATIYYFMWNDLMWNALGLQTIEKMDAYLDPRYNDSFVFLKEEEIDKERFIINSNPIANFSYIKDWQLGFDAFYQKLNLQNNIPQSNQINPSLKLHL